MDCLDCQAKSCKKRGSDCFGLHDLSIEKYSTGESLSILSAASALVDNGRAGKLSRIIELVEFIKMKKYPSVGLAYCFSMEKTAGKVRGILTSAGISVVSSRCTTGGVKECEINPEKTGNAVSCNPAGQAHYLNTHASFVVEMGLCLGHDVLFHQELKVPFTVLIVKDRVHNHNPLAGIEAEEG